MASSIGTAFVDVAFDPKQISGQLGGLGGKVEGGFSKMGGKWGIAAATGFGAAIAGGIAAGKYLYDIGAQFDDMADTIRVSTGKTGKQLDELVKTAKGVGTDVPASFEDAGKAVANVSTRLGLAGKPLRTVSDQMLELARLSGTDLTTALNSVTRMLGDAGFKGAEASKGIDELWRAAQATQVPVTRLSDLLTKFGGPMRQLGFSFEEQAALLGKFEKEGVNTELVMGSMRIALGKMAKAGKDPQTELRKVMQAIHDTGSQSEANAKAIELFGARAGPDMAAAIREGRFSIEQLTKQIAGGRDTVLKAGKDTADFSEQWLIFKNKVAVALAPIAERLFAAIGQGMQFVNEELPPLIDGLQKQLGPTITKLGPMFADLGAVIKDLLPVFRLLADVVEISAKRIADTFRGVADIVAGVVKIIRALLEGDWRGAWEGAKQVVQGVGEVIKAQLDFMKSLLGLALRPLANAAEAIGSAIKQGIVDGVTGVGAFISSTVGAFDDLIRGALAAVAAAAHALGSAIKQGVVDGATGIGAFLSSTVGAFDELLRGALAGAGAAARAVGTAIKDGVVEGITGIGAFVSSTVGAFAGLVRGAVDAAAGAARAVGAAIKDGVVAGVTGVAAAVADVVSLIAGRVRGYVDDAAGAARAIGTAIKGAVVNGITGLADEIYDVVRAEVTAAWRRLRSIGGLVGKAAAKVLPGGHAAPPAPALAPAPTAAPQAGLQAASPAGGTLYGVPAPFAALRRQLAAFSPAAAAAAAAPVTLVRVFIGDEELRGIVRTEVGYADDQTARVVLAGAR